MTTHRQLADAYTLAATWHDKNAASCLAIAADEPRICAEVRARAREAAVHHGASAAGLRLAASHLLRKHLVNTNFEGTVILDELTT